MIDSDSLTHFRAIAEFITDLAEIFAKNHKPLKLYNRLISQTTITHDVPIRKHIEAFRKFCVENRDAISEKNHGKISSPKISYSEHVYINMDTIFKHADNDTIEVIWRHILTISALVDPTGHAKKILQKTSTSAPETDFLTSIINKVEQSVDINANPAQAMGTILNTGIFNDIIQGMGQGMQDGTLDIGKLMGSVNSLVSGLDDNDPETRQMKSNITNMTTMMSNLEAGNANPSQITGMLAPMMSSMIGSGVALPQGGPSINMQEGMTREQGLKVALDAEYKKSKTSGN